MWYLISSNKRKAIILLLCMISFFIVFGGAIGIIVGPEEYVENGIIGVIIGIIAAIAIAIHVKLRSAEIILSMADAVEIPKDSFKVLSNVVEEMSIAANLGFVPKIYLVNSITPNAFSVGVNEKNAAVAVTSGLLSSLTREELEGVIAHEIAHIKNQDTLYMMYAAVIMGTIVLVADVVLRSTCRRRYSSSSSSSRNSSQAIILVIALLFAILSPIAANLFYFSISRKREYLADACAVQYTRYPLGLQSALSKISSPNNAESSLIRQLKSERSGKILSAMFIHNNLQKDDSGFLSEIFSTHPPIYKRIQILKKMSKADVGEYNRVYRSVVSKRNLISPSNMKKMQIQTLAIVAPVLSQDNTSSVQKQRAAKNLYQKLKDYKIINCSCDTIIKLPAEFKAKSVTCPHCGCVHNLENNC